MQWEGLSSFINGTLCTLPQTITFTSWLPSHIRFLIWCLLHKFTVYVLITLPSSRSFLSLLRNTWSLCLALSHSGPMLDFVIIPHEALGVRLLPYFGVCADKGTDFGGTAAACKPLCPIRLRSWLGISHSSERNGYDRRSCFVMDWGHRHEHHHSLWAENTTQWRRHFLRILYCFGNCLLILKHLRIKHVGLKTTTCSHVPL